MEAPLTRATLALGAALIAIGVFAVFVSPLYITAALTIAVGAQLVQLGSAAPLAPAPCCGPPGLVVALRADAAAGGDVTFGCCGCGTRVSCAGPLAAVRNTAIAGVCLALIEWMITFPVTMLVGYVAYGTLDARGARSFAPAELAGKRYALFLVGTTTMGAFTLLVLNVLALQFVQALRLFARAFVADAPRPPRDLARELAAAPPAFAARAAFAGGGDAVKGAALHLDGGGAAFTRSAFADAPRLTPLTV